MRVFRFLLSCFLAVFLIVSPPIIKNGLAKDPRRAVFEKDAPGWYGVVELWHIASFKPYQGSATSFLETCATAYNKKHPGVHIKVTGMTEKKFFERTARGERPDAYSFASGFIGTEDLAPLSVDLPALAFGIPAAKSRGTLYAAPYFFSGYALAVNPQLLYPAGLTAPETVDAAFLQQVLSLEKKTPQLYAPELAAAMFDVRGSLATREQFLEGKSLAGLIDLYTYGAIGRSDTLTILIETLPYAAFTDLVQYIGADAGADETRRGIVADFAAYLLSEDIQRRLPQLGAMPAARDVPGIVFSDDLLADFYAAASGIAAPDPLLYHAEKDALLAEARAALSGDAAAQIAFSGRMEVVLGGES